MLIKTVFASITWIAATTLPAHASPDAFHPGLLIPDFGLIATVDGAKPVPAGTLFKVSYDLTTRAGAGQLNRQLVTAARFLNMHVEAGVKPENMHLALVLHGGAVLDVTKDAVYTAQQEEKNANAPLVAALLEHNVQIIVCGQSAASQELTKDDFLPGVRLAISAMTAHALLQQDGYTMNPF